MNTLFKELTSERAVLKKSGGTLIEVYEKRSVRHKRLRAGGKLAAGLSPKSYWRISGAEWDEEAASIASTPRSLTTMTIEVFEESRRALAFSDN